LAVIIFKFHLKGSILLKTENSSEVLYYLKVSCIGYKTIETDFIDLTQKNKINIDFYLAEDDRPFYSCEGIDSKLKLSGQN
jgi:hypothetical protein